MGAIFTDRQLVQLLQAVSAIKGWIKKNKFIKFILYALQGNGQRGRCTVEKGIALVQARENETTCKYDSDIYKFKVMAM